MQFCSVGAKNIEYDKQFGLQHAVVFDETFTDTINSNETLFNALPNAKTFVDSYDGTKFVTTPCAGQKNNRLYFAMSAGMNDVTTEGNTNSSGFPAGSPVTTSDVFCLRHLYAHRGSENTGKFSTEYESSILGFNNATTDKIGEYRWNSYTPRLIIYPDIAATDLDNSQLCVEKITAGSVPFTYSYSASIYNYSCRGWYAQSFLNVNTKTFSFGISGIPVTLIQGKNVIGTYQRKSISLFQGGNTVTRTGGTTSPTSTYRYRSIDGLDKAGEGGIHQLYAPRTAADDTAKAITRMIFGVAFLDKNFLVVLSAGTDFSAANAIPNSTATLNVSANANFNLFPYYSIKI